MGMVSQCAFEGEVLTIGDKRHEREERQTMFLIFFVMFYGARRRTVYLSFLLFGFGIRRKVEAPD
jgi:hypothetical protein